MAFNSFVDDFIYFTFQSREGCKIQVNLKFLGLPEIDASQLAALGIELNSKKRTETIDAASLREKEYQSKMVERRMVRETLQQLKDYYIEETEKRNAKINMRHIDYNE